MPSENINRLSDYINTNKYKLYPINNFLLKDATDYLINGYFKMLGVVLQQGEDISNGQLALYNRMISGTNAENESADYLRMALEIEIDDYVNFNNEILESPLKYRFILDAMLLNCMGEKDKKQIKLIAEFAEMLKMTTEDLKYLSNLTKVILCMDQSLYMALEKEKLDLLCNSKETQVYQCSFAYEDYRSFFFEEPIIKNDDLIIYKPRNKEETTETYIRKVVSDSVQTVELINVDFTELTDIYFDDKNYGMMFKDKKKVVLDGCTFIGQQQKTIHFEKCDEIIIQNCKFKDFSNRVLWIETSKNPKLKIIGCEFDGCEYKHYNPWNDWNALGGVAWINGGADVFIENCSFNNCGGKNESDYHSSSIICNNRCIVKDTAFSNCWNYYSSGDSYIVDPEDDRRTMFLKGSEQYNCTFENSAKFC